MGAPTPLREVPAEDGTKVPVADTRSKRQRNADALVEAMRRVLAEGGDDIARPNVVVYTDQQAETAECEQIGPVAKPWLARMLCDAVIHHATRDPNGQINLGRIRTVSHHQRRVLVARDRTCVIPGCQTLASWCEAHHVQWYSKGGRTDLDNLAMVCGRHHDAIHAGIWELEMRAGVPWARPPDWIDPQRRLIRNTYPDHRERATQLGLDLAPPGHPAA
jgi:hypothetical protein